ncbi:potassium channel family protein [Xylophilus sp. GOD-11R]|uniref:potassium channel family protein n=1 Tax=Xylophilus sp. GOD-11R TaxID=3089814 RepID=UPI00298BDDB2|nr:potassium channel family protein [Xylophilus sp. GOD-11R]WPB55836.1 potassium channel family protein [Xylophilus sp. GOD-11R]
MFWSSSNWRVMTVSGSILVLLTLMDAFEVVLLPRTVRRRMKINRYFFRLTWLGWAWLGLRLKPGRRREDFLAVYGPLSMVALFGLWATCLIVGFGLVQWSLLQSGAEGRGLAGQIIVSGDAFFTLGYGDNVPHARLARFLVILEAGTGFGFIALTIGYLPVLYQHFTRRDVQLIEFSLRAGTPASTLQLLAWHAQGGQDGLERWLARWESWAAELIESHAAYPMLAFYRSQHEGHSWVGALTTVMDVCGLVIAGAHAGQRHQAAATFAALRRTLVEVGDALLSDEAAGDGGRSLDADTRERIGAAMRAILPDWREDAAAATGIDSLRRHYEPRVTRLAAYLLLPLPCWDSPTAMAKDSFGREAVLERLTDRHSP